MNRFIVVKEKKPKPEQGALHYKKVECLRDEPRNMWILQLYHMDGSLELRQLTDQEWFNSPWRLYV